MLKKKVPGTQENVFLAHFFSEFFTGRDPGRGSGQEVLKILPRRVGSGRVRKFSNMFRVGPGHLDPARPARRNLTRGTPGIR